MAKTMSSDNTAPSGTVGSNSGIKVAKDNEFVCCGNPAYSLLQLKVKGLFDLIRIGHGWGIDTEQGQMLVASQR